MAPSHVLVPLDGSPLSEEALRHALDVYDCPITVLNVITPLDTGTSEGGVLEPEQDRIAEARDRADAVTEKMRERIGAGEQSTETVVKVGDPAKAILEYVDSQDVDHVVMGSHSRDDGRLRRRLLGTVSTAVIGEAPVPVTIIR